MRFKAKIHCILVLKKIFLLLINYGFKYILISPIVSLLFFIIQCLLHFQSMLSSVFIMCIKKGKVDA